MNTTRKLVLVKDLEPGDVIACGGTLDVTVGAYPVATSDGWMLVMDETGEWHAHYRPTDTVRMATYE